MTEPKQPHDALFKKTFSDVEHAAAELRAVLPPQLVALTDFSTLTLCPGSFVDETLAGSQSDLLFTAQIANKPALLYILFEHQSTPDKLLPLRLLRYVLRILERHVSSNSKAEALPLPLVIPVVIHHSETGWNSPDHSKTSLTKTWSRKPACSTSSHDSASCSTTSAACRTRTSKHAPWASCPP